MRMGYIEREMVDKGSYYLVLELSIEIQHHNTTRLITRVRKQSTSKHNDTSINNSPELLRNARTIVEGETRSQKKWSPTLCQHFPTPTLIEVENIIEQ